MRPDDEVQAMRDAHTVAMELGEYHDDDDSENERHGPQHGAQIPLRRTAQRETDATQTAATSTSSSSSPAASSAAPSTALTAVMPSARPTGSISTSCS